MKLKKYFKYAVRFLFLQSVLTFFTTYYFDNYLLPQGALKNNYRIQIDANLLEDKNRFFGFISDNFVKIDIVLAIFIFLFLIFLFSTKFYTYVNELSFSLDTNYFGIFLNFSHMDIFCDGIYNNATICKPDFKRLSTYIYFLVPIFYFF